MGDGRTDALGAEAEARGRACAGAPPGDDRTGGGVAADGGRDAAGEELTEATGASAIGDGGSGASTTAGAARIVGPGRTVAAGADAGIELGEGE